MTVAAVIMVLALPAGAFLDRRSSSLAPNPTCAGVLLLLAGLHAAAPTYWASSAASGVTLVTSMVLFRLGFSLRAVGLTGGIGCGKTTVSNCLEGIHGLRIVDADLIARVVVQPGCYAYNKIVQRFGKKVLEGQKEGGDLDRTKLGELVFGNRDSLKALNKITHPMIMIEMLKQLMLHRFVYGHKHVVLDAPLLYESGPLHYLCKPVLAVILPSEMQINRTLQRDKTDAKQVLARIKSQMPNEVKAKRANIVIVNDGTPHQLASVVTMVVEQLKSDYPHKLHFDCQDYEE